jgi:hypothetical protein
MKIVADADILTEFAYRVLFWLRICLIVISTGWYVCGYRIGFYGLPSGKQVGPDYLVNESWHMVRVSTASYWLVRILGLTACVSWVAYFGTRGYYFFRGDLRRKRLQDL